MLVPCDILHVKVFYFREQKTFFHVEVFIEAKPISIFINSKTRSKIILVKLLPTQPVVEGKTIVNNLFIWDSN